MMHRPRAIFARKLPLIRHPFASAIVLLSLMSPQTAFAVIAFVQNQENTATANNDNIATGNFGGAVTSANLMVCVVRYISTSRIVSSLSDGVGSTFQKAVGPTTGIDGLANDRQEIWYAYNITGAGTYSVTVTFDAVFNASKSVLCHEYSGALTGSDPKDVTAAAAGQNLFTPASGLAATSAPAELIFGAAVVSNAANASGTGFIPRSSLSGNITEDKIAWTAGPAQATVACSYNDDWIVQMVAFKSATTTPPAGISLVQGASEIFAGNTPAAGNSLAVSFDANNTAGNFIWVGVYFSSTGRTLTVSDTVGNTYNLVATADQSADAHQIWIYYAMNIGSGANTVTATVTGANNADMAVHVLEYRGIATTDALDKSSAAVGTGTSVNSGDTATTTVANELLAGMVGFSGNSGPFTPTGGFSTLRLSINVGTNLQSGVQARIVSATGAYATTGTIGVSHIWSAILATFKAATTQVRVKHSVREY